MSSPLVRLEEIEKIYRRGEASVAALRGLSLEVGEGEYLAITGPSGSGKSSLLALLGCLDRPTSGRYLLGGQDTSGLDDDALSAIRNHQIGFVFQSFNLLADLSVLENVETPLHYAGVALRTCRERALTALERVGLGARVHHRPGELSGGEAQRAAIARALVIEPRLLLADEPTGNLDSVTGDEVARQLEALHADGRTVVVVTHNATLAARAERIVRLRDGRREE